jgi:hypothetical protein
MPCGAYGKNDIDIYRQEQTMIQTTETTDDVFDKYLLSRKKSTPLY